MKSMRTDLARSGRVCGILSHSSLERTYNGSIPYCHGEGSRCVHARARSTEEVVYTAFTVPKPISKNAPVKQRNKRNIVYAVDGTDNAREGMEWIVAHVLRTGDVLHVVQVVNNDLAFPVSVGMINPGGNTIDVCFDEDFSLKKIKDHGDRLASTTAQKMDEELVPIVEHAGFSVTTSVRVVEGYSSAALIGEAIVREATEQFSDMLIVTSHGGGLKCSYGSVARYCVTHFQSAVVILPPQISSHPCVSSPSLCVGVNTLSELQDATSWTLRNLHRSGDDVHIFRVEEQCVTSASGTDQMSIMLGLQEQVKQHKVKNIRYEQLPTASGDEMGPDEQNKAAAEDLQKAAVKHRARCLVMVNYAGRGMLQTMMYGTLAMMCSRNASMPLALIPPDSAFD